MGAFAPGLMIENNVAGECDFVVLRLALQFLKFCGDQSS